MPYKCEANMATDEIFKSWPFRLVSNPVFAVVSQVFNFWLLWLLVRRPALRGRDLGRRSASSRCGST